MRVLIVGAGEIGQRLMADLSRDDGVEVVVIDVDPSLCDRLAAQYDALVIHGDATDPDVLEEAQIAEADALVVTTGSDATNTVVGVLGVQHDVGRVIVKLLSPGLRSAVEGLGVGTVIMPAVAAASRIQVALHGDKQSDLDLLTRGKLQIAELTVPESLDGVAVRDIDLPEQAAAAGIVRGDSADVAAPGARVQAGDVLLVVVDGEEAAERLEATFEGDDDAGRE